MTKAELVAKIAEEVGITKVQAEKTLTVVIATVTKEVKQSDSMVLPGLGTFSLLNRNARTGRNPQTGAEINIPASKTVKFKCAKALKDAVN